ncbi:unnamed protein product [Amoebophrya sp. A25]|nr:unnamed protein product [Amoebophrya sp. A25]|eukprot:GSA25T00021891001.1
MDTATGSPRTPSASSRFDPRAWPTQTIWEEDREDECLGHEGDDIHPSVPEIDQMSHMLPPPGTPSSPDEENYTWSSDTQSCSATHSVAVAATTGKKNTSILPPIPILKDASNFVRKDKQPRHVVNASSTTGATSSSSSRASPYWAAPGVEITEDGRFGSPQENGSSSSEERGAEDPELTGQTPHVHFTFYNDTGYGTMHDSPRYQPADMKVVKIDHGFSRVHREEMRQPCCTMVDITVGFLDVCAILLPWVCAYWIGPKWSYAWWCLVIAGLSSIVCMVFHCRGSEAYSRFLVPGLLPKMIFIVTWLAAIFLYYLGNTCVTVPLFGEKRDAIAFARKSQGKSFNEQEFSENWDIARLRVIRKFWIGLGGMLALHAIGLTIYFYCGYKPVTGYTRMRQRNLTVQNI